MLGCGCGYNCRLIIYNSYTEGDDLLQHMLDDFLVYLLRSELHAYKSNPNAMVTTNVNRVCPTPVSAHYSTLSAPAPPIPVLCTRSQEVQALIDAGTHPDDEKDAVSFCFPLGIMRVGGHCVGGSSIKVCVRFRLGRRVAVVRFSDCSDSCAFPILMFGVRASRACHKTRLVMRA